MLSRRSSMDVLYIILVCLIFSSTNADLLEDKQALLDFLNSLPHSRPLNWNENNVLCKNWTGVTCNVEESRVIALRLPGVGFKGPIPKDTLSRLSALQVLSLRSNDITGEFPSDFANLRNLTLFYLHYNNFSGTLPFDFSVWKNLAIINFSHNRFNGSIPSSLSNLSQLAALNLADNLLEGEIPAFDLPSLQHLNLSNNNLSGIVPKSLLKFPRFVFEGNNNISFVNYPPPSVPLTDSKRKRKTFGKIGGNALLGIVVAGCVVGIILCAALLIIYRSKIKSRNEFEGKLQKGDVSPDKGVSRDASNNKLVFFEGCIYVFDLEDLLRASAEVLGKGTFGTSYKAILEDANLVVVKRLKDVSVGRREFEQQMEVIGNIKHRNVVELRAYYYAKDEKLMVYDYNNQGSVAALLHGNRGENRIPLDWNTRMKIAIGAARGLSRIHLENNGKLVHGNIKSSNIFLNPRQYGCISDIGLSTIMAPLSSPISRAAGYRAPEVSDTRKAQQPSDVFSFGVVILELLTGKSPVHTTSGDEVVHLVRWVHSVVREEWTAEVFDLELMRYPNIEEELVEMLQIAMACVARHPEQRPRMAEVVTMVENVRRADNGNRTSSETRSDVSTPLV